MALSFVSASFYAITSLSLSGTCNHLRLLADYKRGPDMISVARLCAMYAMHAMFVCIRCVRSQRERGGEGGRERGREGGREGGRECVL